MFDTTRYDYAVIGAGIAGCVLANRISADPTVTVLLIEAGPDAISDPRIDQPSRWPELLGGEYDWGYRTTPQRQLNQRRLDWPRGRVVGGSGSLNAMVYVRGNASDYDGWARYGGPQWGAAAMRSWFAELESAVAGSASLSVVDQQHPHPLSRAFVAAGQEIGLPYNPDFNGAEQRGVGFYRLTQHEGRRYGAASAYLAPVVSRPNLTVFPGTRVAWVRISHQRATGVTIGRAGRLLDIDVDREVILCAGVVESPHLLMLSGIGPADHLRRHGIDVSVDLPGVGGNLHDHVQVWRSFGCRPGPPVAPGSNLGEAGGFASVLDQSGVPDVQLSFVPKMTLDPADARPGFTIASAVARPTSRGRISLASADPWQPPVIEPNYLATEHDMNILVAGARLVGSLADSHALSGYRDRGGDDPMPDDLREFCRDTAQTQFHPVGTCRFGNDQDAVVDPELRVRGIDGLRVVDASVMPAVTTGNTAAPVFAIAAKAAAMIGNRTGDGTTMASTVW